MLRIREAVPEDASLIVQFIKDLAEYEREPHAAVVDEQDILRDGFSPLHETRFWVLIAEWDGKPAGFAFYFFNYSTWLGKPGLYLEDLFVEPTMRGKGIGKALLARLAQVAIDNNCYGMRWQVLDWNQPAIDFYNSLGGEIMKPWLTVRLTGEPLKKLARQEK
jgi:GNAT superfamily N-acetyltransferase